MAKPLIYNLIKLDEDGNPTWNQDGMKKLCHPLDFNFERILSTCAAVGNVNAMAFFGKQEEILKQLTTLNIAHPNESEFEKEGIYVIDCRNIESSFEMLFISILDDKFFGRDQLPYVATRMLNLMMKISPVINFLLSNQEIQILNQINALYSSKFKLLHEFRTEQITSRTVLNLNFETKEKINEEKVRLVPGRVSGAFATEKQLRFDRTWKAKETLILSDYAALIDWMKEKSEQFHFESIVMKNGVSREQREGILKAADRWPTFHQNGKSDPESKIESSWRSFWRSLHHGNPQKELRLKLVALEEIEAGGIKCTYKSQRWKGGEFSNTVGLLNDPKGKKTKITYNLNSNVVNHWVYTIDETTLILVVAFKDYTVINMIQDGMLKELDRFEFETTQCAFSDGISKIAMVTQHESIEVYQMDKKLIQRIVVSDGITFIGFGEMDQIVVRLQDNGFQLYSIESGELLVPNLPISLPSNAKPFMMSGGRILGDLSLKKKWLQLSMFDINDQRIIPPMDLNLTLEKFTCQVSGDRLYIFANQDFYIYRIETTDQNQTTVAQQGLSSGLDLSWLSIIRLVVNELGGLTPGSYQFQDGGVTEQQVQVQYEFRKQLQRTPTSTDFDAYVTKLFAEGAYCIAKPQPSNVLTSLVNVNGILQGLLTGIPVPISCSGIMDDCISSLGKPCFVICATGKDPLQHTLNCITGSSFIHVKTRGSITMKIYTDYVLVIIDWSGSDELKALTFCANVANYTICSSDGPDTLALLDTIPAETLLEQRSNTGPLCFFPSANAEPVKLSQVSAHLTKYFDGRVDTVIYDTETSLVLPCKRVLLECTSRALDLEKCYSNGKECMDRINQALSFAFS